jgi:hypothetical protein
MAVIPAVGVGLSAISTFSAIQQQNKQARAQEDALHNQELDAATRLELAKENWQFTAEAAQQVKDRELALNVAQRKQAMAQIKQQGIEQQLASTTRTDKVASTSDRRTVNDTSVPDARTN